jgi:hypothetical protein
MKRKQHYSTASQSGLTWVLHEERVKQERENLFHFVFDRRQMEEIRTVVETGQVGLLPIVSTDVDISPVLLLSPGNPDVGCIVPITNSHHRDLKCHATLVTMMSLLTTMGAEVFYATWSERPLTLRNSNLTKHVHDTFEWNLFDPENPPNVILEEIDPFLAYGIPDYPNNIMGIHLDFKHTKLSIEPVTNAK